MEDCVDVLVNSLSDYNKEAEEIVAEEDEENGTSKTGSGGGLIEQIMSHLPVAITGVSNTSAAAVAESLNEDKIRDEPEAEKAEESEGISSSQHVALPVDNGPDPVI